MDEPRDAVDLDKILRRIRKCLALSRSPEPHEAAAALRQAQKLMETYGVTERDVSLAKVREARTPAGRTTRCPPAWLSRLGHAVSAAFGASHYYQVHPGRACYYMFVGVGPRAEVAGYAFAVLRRQCTSARRTYFTGLRGARSSRVRRADAHGTRISRGSPRRSVPEPRTWPM